MPDVLDKHPGLLFVAATLLPLLSVILLLLGGGLRNALRSSKNSGGVGASLFHLLGGEVTGRGPAYIATGAIGLAFVCSLIGFILFLMNPPHHGDHGPGAHAAGAHGHKHPEAKKEDGGKKDEKDETKKDDSKKSDAKKVE